MEVFARIVAWLVMFGAIELVDKHVDAFNWHWALSLLVAAVFSVGDIIFLAVLDSLD